MDAVRDGSDDAICGTCALRGSGGRDRQCYVTPWLGPYNVWKALGKYLELGWDDLQALVEGRSIRLGAYGDPAAVPFEVWQMLLAGAGGHVGYSHAWRTCDPRLKTIVMASVDTEDEFHVAHLAGWRTFRVRTRSTDPILAYAQRPLEFVCPASDEGNHRTTCARCQLCRGTSSPARSVVIAAHGKPSTLKAYGLTPVQWFGNRGMVETADDEPSVVCAACAEDFAPNDEGQRICVACAALGWAERPCVGCQRTIVSDGRRTRCVDCQLAHQRAQFTKRVSRKHELAAREVTV